MPTATWPGTLPVDPAIAGYQEQPPNIITRQNMDVGPAKVRKRFTAGVRVLKVRFFFTPAQMTAFDTFYLEIIEGGALPFTWTLPRTGGAATCRIVETPTYELPQGFKDIFQVDLTIEVLP